MKTNKPKFTPLQKKRNGTYNLQMRLPPIRGEAYVNFIEQELELPVGHFTKQLIFDFLKGVISPESYKELEEKDKIKRKNSYLQRRKGQENA